MGLQIVMRGHQEQMTQPRPAPGRRPGGDYVRLGIGYVRPIQRVVVSHALERLSGTAGWNGKNRAIMAVGARAVSRLEEAGEKVEASFAIPGCPQRHYLPGPGNFAED